MAESHGDVVEGAIARGSGVLQCCARARSVSSASIAARTREGNSRPEGCTMLIGSGGGLNEGSNSTR